MVNPSGLSLGIRDSQKLVMILTAATTTTLILFFKQMGTQKSVGPIVPLWLKVSYPMAHSLRNVDENYRNVDDVSDRGHQK